MSRRFTTEEFIKRAIEVHGEKYDYSKVDYKDNKTKVIIICPIHGEFEQTPYSHSTGIGCAKCSGTGRFTTKEFIQKAKEIHGEKYDYSKVVYKNSKTQIIIICPDHGEFTQKPSEHLNNHGCSKCSKNYRRNKEEFIKDAIKIHGNKYDYSKVVYVDNKTKVTIICPIHGEFQQNPGNHINQKQGCIKCYRDRQGQLQKSTIEEFIQKARKIHGDKYDYSKVNYQGAMTKTTIICPTHGEFNQKPHDHLNGNGCAKCSGHGFEYKTLEELKKIIKPLNIQHQKDYYNWWKKNEKFCRRNGIPYDPYMVFKKKS